MDYNVSALLSLILSLSLLRASSAQLRPNYYSAVCPNLEPTVRAVVAQKFRQTFVTVPATLRLFFHDCFVEGCDASVVVASTPGNTAEKDHPDNLSLAGDGFDTVIKAKEAVDNIPGCKNKVSCADILAIAARDVISLAGGPWYQVELGRRDGLTSKASNVEGRLPKPTFNLKQLNSLFASHGLTQTDMIALSAAHTVVRQVRRPDIQFQQAKPSGSNSEPAIRGPITVFVPKECGPTDSNRYGPSHSPKIRQPILQEFTGRKGPVQFGSSSVHGPPVQAHCGRMGQEPKGLPRCI